MESGQARGTTIPERRERTRRRRTVMATDGNVYTKRLGERVVLELLARVDDGFAVFMSIDGVVFLELPAPRVPAFA